MTLAKHIICMSIACSVICSPANADVLYTVISPTLTGITLFDQELGESGFITVKPSIQEGTGDTLVLNQCLWSIRVDLATAVPNFEAGKMICVGPNQEVLESNPSGVVEAFGECSDASCSRFTVSGDITVNMLLQKNLEFSLQPRNERK